MSITENTDRTTSNYRHMIRRYSDSSVKKQQKKDERTGEEIAADVIKMITKKG